jgi:hypothetical protein
VTRAWEGSRTGFGHGPFTATRPSSAERGANLVDHQQNGLRLWIRLSKDSWDMDWTSACKCRYAVRGQKCTDAAIFC